MRRKHEGFEVEDTSEVARESLSTFSEQTVYIRDVSTGTLRVLAPVRWKSVTQALRSILLPQGYPESVTEDYLPYQIWDSLQAFCSSINSTLATHAVLKGVGVGDESATALAATITWMLKDGAGMLGQIVFVWMKSSALDSEPKRWRLYADILNDATFFLQLLGPFFKSYFTFIVCVSGVCLAIVGIAGSATRAALMQHQARRNNMADLAAKDGTQETFVNLTALLVNLFIVPLIVGNQTVVWAMFLLLTCCHILCNYLAVSHVVMETFNPCRLRSVVDHFLKTGEVMGVKETNQKEPVVLGIRSAININMGCSFKQMPTSSRELDRVLGKKKQYLIYINLKSKRISVVLHQRSTVLDELEACWHAHILHYCYSNMFKTAWDNFSELKDITQSLQAGDVISALELSHQFCDVNFPMFIKRVKATGWDVDHVTMGTDEWRATWVTGS